MDKLSFDISDVKSLKITVNNKFNIWAMDIETITNAGGGLEPIAIVVKSKDEIYKFFGINCVDNFTNWLTSYKTDLPTKVYVHNGSNFDFIFLLKNILDKKEYCKVTNLRGKIITLKIGSKDFTFCDSYRLFNASLANTCKSWGIELSKDIPFHHKFQKQINLYNYAGVNFDNNTQNEMVEYCTSDTIALYELMIKFQADLRSKGLSLLFNSNILIETILCYVQS